MVFIDQIHVDFRNAQQDRNDLLMALGGRNVQRRPSIVIRRIHVDWLQKQVFDFSGVPFRSSEAKFSCRAVR
jgi:hypothetical protein